MSTNTGYSTRAQHAGSIGTIFGYAAKFDSLSEDLGGFKETLAPGSFTGALARLDNDVRALVDHDSSRIIGRTSAGTLRVSQDTIGLRYEIDVADTQAGRDILQSVERGDVRGASFAFTVANDRWFERAGETRREITEIGRLFDVSPVSFPATTTTTAKIGA